MANRARRPSVRDRQAIGLTDVTLRFEEGTAPEVAAWVYRHAVDGEPVLSVANVGERYLVRTHGVADFWIAADIASADAVLLPGVSRSRAQEVFDHQVRPGLHQLRGAPALHGAAVAVGAGTIAFLGTSGAGKSTLAAHLSRVWPLVCDDYLPLRLENDHVWSMGTSSWVRLREATVEAMGEAGELRNGKTAVARPHEQAPRPLTRIFVLAPPTDVVMMKPVSRRDAMVAVARHLHRLDPQNPTLLRRELEMVDAVAVRVPVCELSYPHEFSRLHEVEHVIARELAEP